MTTKNQKTKTAVAVLTSDVHYSLKTLELADAAMRLAIAKANELDVPLIVAGDLMNDKANMRAEVVSAMIKTFQLTNHKTLILRGNHDQVNEKSQEHALDFLGEIDELIYVIDEPAKSFEGWHLIPYHHNPEELRAYLKTIPPKSTLIMHQGIKNADGGDYIQDHSAITVDDVAGHRVISGHYHNRQTIELPDGGQWDYIGNPYTLTFGEANDPEKGFRVLYSDGSLYFVPTNLRRHVKIEQALGHVNTKVNVGPNDLVWLKLTGPAKNLAGMDKGVIRSLYSLPQDFRLELIPDDIELSATESKADIPKDQQLDAIIDSATNVDSDQKARVKALWKDLATKEEA